MALRRQLKVFMGPMWSGKTNRLIECVDRASLDFARIVVIKHGVDTRHPAAVVARNGLSLPATLRTDCLARDVVVEPRSLYAIDEAQFFDGSDLLAFAAAVLQPGDFRSPGSSLLVVASLDLDFARRPFGGVLRLAHAALAPASDAPFSQRLRAGGVDTVLVGGGEFYQPSCAVHHSCDPVDADVWLAPAHIE